MGGMVKITISLPADLVKEVGAIARAEGKTFSGVIQDALRSAQATRLKKELHHLQGYWSRKAEEKGLFTEQDLDRYLRPTS